MKTELIKKISRLFSEESMSQREIAEKLGISQATVSRYKQIGVEDGIIQPVSEGPPSTKKNTSKELCKKYNLKEVIIVYSPNLEASTGISFFRRMGEHAASYYDKILKPGVQISVSHGRSVFYTIKAISERRILCNIDPLMLIRGVGIAENKLSALLNAVHLSAKYWMDMDEDRLFIPQYSGKITDTNLSQVIESMYQEPSVQESLKRISKSDIILVSVGPLYEDATFVRGAEKLGISFSELKEMGVVGSICHTPVEKDGNPITLKNIHKLAITITLEDLRKLALDKNRDIILISGGRKKLDVIRTALECSYCNVLVTDEVVAELLLR